MNLKGKVLSIKTDGFGRHLVNLCDDGRIKTFKVHRLVMQAFVGPVPKDMVVCHNDGNAANNHLGNLRYDTQKGNMADKRRHGTQPVGEAVNTAKLTVADVQAIRRLLWEGVSQKEISARFGLAQSAISDIKTRKSWSHI